jgi:hypothetical protein
MILKKQRLDTGNLINVAEQYSTYNINSDSKEEAPRTRTLTLFPVR